MSNDQSAKRRQPEAGGEPEVETTAGPAAESNEPESNKPGENPAAEPANATDGADAESAPDAVEADGEAAAGAEPEGETAEAEMPPEALEAEIARLDEELATVRAQADDYWQRLVRSEAEKENVRKRARKEADNARRQGMEKLANELLAVRDSLEMGLDAARQEEADAASIREGTELTLKMLTQAMEKCDIERIDPAGERFNPDLHQAMSMQEVEGQESNTVISVMQKGYRMGDRLLRPALVMVAK